jgi:hypothetical protein
MGTDGTYCIIVFENPVALLHFTHHNTVMYSSILDVQSFRVADSDTDHCQVVAKVRDRLAVSKQTAHRVHMERFNLKKLKEV